MFADPFGIGVQLPLHQLLASLVAVDLAFAQGAAMRERAGTEQGNKKDSAGNRRLVREKSIVSLFIDDQSILKGTW